MKKSVVFILVLGLLSTVGFAQVENSRVDDPKSKEIMDKVSASLRSYTNFKIDFDYTMEDKAHNINETMGGTVVMQGERYNLSLMGRTIISDGKTIWAYSPDDEEVQISTVEAGSETSNPWAIITDYEKSFRSKLIKSVNEGGKTYYIIDLYPKETKAYHKIRVKIDKGSMQLVSGVIHNKDNVTYTYKVKNFKPNVSVPANHFIFSEKDYPDVDVIDLR